MVIAAAATLAAASVLLHCSPDAPGTPRALLITVDTMRPDRMSLYGYDRDTTPNLRRFFGDAGFRNARSSAPCTLPAVKQMLTGRLDMQGATIAEALRDAGIPTAAVTSQHWFSGDEVYRRGFDHWDVQAGDELDRYGMSARRASRVTDLALDWIRGRSPGERFFLWVHYFDPHDPYDPPPDARRFSEGVTRYPDGDRRAAQLAGRTDEEHWFQVDHVFDDEDRDALRRLYDDEIRFTDREIGRLLDGLEARGASGLGVIVSDTFGRPWREALVDMAIGSAGVDPILDVRGGVDWAG
ncbi:MAG TPA: sulfatase-like hydrolase/transferase, partial [bacterium]|nr:sulfatase-like hydrolase/transferase [bacterium]